MTNHHDHGKRRGHGVFVILIATIITIVIFHWAWNGVGDALLQLPAASFIDIAAIIVAYAAILGLARLIFMRQTTDPHSK